MNVTTPAEPRWFRVSSIRTLTRAASDEQLREESSARLAALRAGGVTTVEVKSGYALDVQGEARLVDLAAELTEDVTFLGAHAVPKEFARDRARYVELVAGEMMSRCARAKWTDVFCDEGAFDVDEARVVLEAGRRAGHQLRLHANQIVDIGGVTLAVEMQCASVDHCTFVSDQDVERLAASSTVATLLPGAEFSTRSPYSSGRRLLDAGVSVALATDCNPGTSYVTSMSFVVALAVREMGLSVDEALWSATRGGAMTSAICRSVRAATWSSSTLRARRTSRIDPERNWSERCGAAPLSEIDVSGHKLGT